MEEQQPPQKRTTVVLDGKENGPGCSEGSSGSSNNAATCSDEQPGVSGVHLVLMCMDTNRHVTFQQGVIDNEGMNRRKSKCCCIYRKPHAFGESSSSSDDECEHCCGHPEVRLRNRLKKQAQMCGCGCHCQHQHHRQPAVAHLAACESLPFPCSVPTPATSLPLLPATSSPEVAGDSHYADSDKVAEQPARSLSLLTASSEVSNRDDSIIT